MREIEIKARVAKPAELHKRLSALDVVLNPPKKQHDIVYSLPGAQDNQPEANWLRIRIENDTTNIFTLKRSVSGELDSIEHEVTFDDVDELTKIIGYLGYELFSDLTKIRRKAKYGDIEICVDELPGLGNFIEVEKLCEEDADYASVAAELWQLFSKLGITRADEETHGYDVLMRAHEDSNDA